MEGYKRERKPGRSAFRPCIYIPGTFFMVLKEKERRKKRKTNRERRKRGEKEKEKSAFEVTVNRKKRTRDEVGEKGIRKTQDRIRSDNDGEEIKRTRGRKKKVERVTLMPSNDW